MAKIKKSKDKIAVAMSGGVDSSVAAKLLKKDYDPTGIFLHFWKEEVDGEEVENKCCSIKALNDARRVCQKIGLPLYTLNFSEVFKKKIVDDFLSEYEAGRTPNPCVRCNKSVKLGLLIKKAKELGFLKVASGHYVRLEKQGGKYKLFKAWDENKDQSYFLYTFSQDELKHLLFPLGRLKKEKVRAIAKRAGLAVAEKKESQEICFISGKSHNDFLRRHIKLKPGPIKLLNSPLTKGLPPACAGRAQAGGGGIIGKHQGLPLYTVGQRKGVDIGGIGPFYVARQDYKTNTLRVVSDGNDKILFKEKLIAGKVNWISGHEPKMPFKCEAVIRYRHKPIRCVISKKNKNKYSVVFKEPQRAVTPGQSVVFYKGDEVLGGGIIE